MLINLVIGWASQSWMPCKSLLWGGQGNEYSAGRGLTVSVTVQRNCITREKSPHLATERKHEDETWKDRWGNDILFGRICLFVFLKCSDKKIHIWTFSIKSLTANHQFDWWRDHSLLTPYSLNTLANSLSIS